MYELYIANKNYSSWSLRPWALLHELEIPFEERMVPFGDAAAWHRYCTMNPSGKVPCLVDGDGVVWDSLAIAEYLAERHPSVWPADARARTWARCAAAEMHSGFGELRSRCAMSCGVRIRLHENPPPLERDLARINELWKEGLRRFDGPFLAGAAFTAVDAFFAPVAFRVQTYGLLLEPVATAYARRLLALKSLRQWYADGIAETRRDAGHEADIRAAGIVLEDHRASG